MSLIFSFALQTLIKELQSSSRLHTQTLPDIASCCIFRSIWMEGLSSGLGTPDCVVRVPRKLGSF